LTRARWPDLETVFNARGCAMARSCWCVFYRVRGRGAALESPEQKQRDANRDLLLSLADANPPAGLIGYDGDQPVGWISLGPREDFRKLANSPIMKPVDDQPVWSIVCFVVPPAYRSQGIAHALLAAAIDMAHRHGALCLESYPVDRDAGAPHHAAWFGSRSMFEKAGFTEVARRRADRPVMRLSLVPKT